MSSKLPTSEENLSDHFDNAPNPGASELTDDQSTLVADWKQLGDSLREIPVPSVSLSSVVRRGIEEAELVAAAAPEATPQPSRRQSAIAVAVSSFTVAVCLLALMYFPAPLRGVSFQQSLVSGFTSSELASEFSNCDVVMITMPEGSEETTHLLRTSLGSRGMESHPIPVDSMPSQNSQLLGFDADSEEVLGALTALNDATGDKSIDSMGREEILAKLLQSLETPSLAEEHFGDYVVVLPRDVIDAMRQDAGVIAEAEAPQNAESPPSHIPAESRKLVFVVRRKKTADAGGVDLNGASLEPRNLPVAESV